MKDEIENVKRQKMAVVKSVKDLHENLVGEAIAGDRDQNHAVKSAPFAKTFILIPVKSLCSFRSILKDLLIEKSIC